MKLLKFLQREWTPIIFGFAFLVLVYAFPKIGEVIAGIGIIIFIFLAGLKVFITPMGTKSDPKANPGTPVKDGDDIIVDPGPTPKPPKTEV